MKYLFVAKKFVSLKRGAWTISEDLVKYFSQNLTLKEDIEILNIKDEVLEYDKVVFVTQVPHLYSFPLNFITLYDTNHLVYIRSEHNLSTYNSCTNGFYYYLEHPDIKNYIPFIPNLQHKEIKEERYGFYYRPYLNPDACKWFINRFKNTNEPIMTMGMIPEPFVKRKNWIHTYDRDEFWSSISTYFYPISTKYVDPFPSSIVESIQTGKDIVFPSLGNRNYRDGIDDCIDVVKYDRNLFNFSNFIPFYRSVINNNMDNVVDRNEYSNIIDWIFSIL